MFIIIKLWKLLRYYRIVKALEKLSKEVLDGPIKYYIWNQVQHKKVSDSAIINVIRDRKGW